MNKPFYARYFDADKGTTGADNTESTVVVSKEAEPFKVFDSQSDFDSFIDQRLDKARQKWSDENKTAVDDAVAEALRQAQLSEEEKVNEAAAQRDAELAELREKVALGERKTTAAQKLANAGLDASLIGALNLSSDEALTASVDALAQVIPTAIQAGIEAKLASETKTPAKATANNAINATAEALGLKSI